MYTILLSWLALGIMGIIVQYRLLPEIDEDGYPIEDDKGSEETVIVKKTSTIKK